MRFDEFTFSLPRLWIVVCALVLVDFLCLASFGVPIVSSLMRWLPLPLARVLFLYGPFAVTAIWLVIVVLGAAFHGWRALWLLLPAAVFLPATYLQLVVWACAVHGACP